MAQAAIKVGQAFIPIEIDFTGVNKRVAKSVARTMNYASKSATFPIRHTMFAGAAPAFTRALTRTNFAADALFKGKFSNRLNKGFSQSLATAMSRTSVPVNAGMFSGLASAFQKGMKGGAVKPESMFKGGLPGFRNFGAAAYSAFIAAFTVGSALTARTAIKSYGEFERAQIGLTSMLKSSEKANALLKDIQDFAVVSPFNVQNLIDASKQMTAFGFQTGEIIPMMRDIGDAAAALGTGDEGIQRMVRAMGQIRVKGRVMAEELLQLTEIGVSGPKFIAEHLGITTEEALKRVNKGQIDAATGLAALRKGMQKYFGGSIKAQENTLFGLWANLKDQFEIAARLLFTPLADDTRGLLKGAIDSLEKVKKWAETDWPAIVKQFKEDPKSAVRDLAKRMYEGFAKQDWTGAFNKIKATFNAGLDLAGEVPWLDIWRGFRKKALESYLYVKGLDWPGIWGKTEEAGGKLAASLKSYDWKGLGQFLKGEVLDAWETGKNIVGYLKEKFDQIDWSGIGTNLAEHLGRGRQAIVDKLQGMIDEGLSNTSEFIDNTNWAQAGAKAGEILGENVRSAIKSTIDVTLDIGQWVLDKVTGFDYEKHLNNAGDFLGNFSTALTAKLFDVDEEQIKAIPGKIQAAINDLANNGAEGQTGLAIRLGSVQMTDTFIKGVQDAANLIDKSINDALVGSMEGTVDEQAVRESGKTAGGIFGAAFLAAAESLEKAENLFGTPEDTAIKGYDHAINLFDAINDSAKTTGEAMDKFNQEFNNSFNKGQNKQHPLSRIFQSVGVIIVKTFIHAFSYIFGWLGGAVTGMLNGIKGEFDAKFGGLFDALGIKYERGGVGNSTTNPNRNRKPSVEFTKEEWQKHLQTLFVPQAIPNNPYDPAKLVKPPSRKPLFPNPGNNFGSRDFGQTGSFIDTRKTNFYGKSGKVEIHQHFDGRYIQPEQAKRASKLGLQAGV